MNKQKLGILTFHTACNYGAVLQAYAMKEICEELGYEVYFIRYSGYDQSRRIGVIESFIKAQNKKKALVNSIRCLLSYRGDKKRFNEFKRFRKEYFKETDLCKTIEDIKKLDFDVYISGSDQIWNYRITGNKFDKGYFLDFDSNAKKIIYAASSQDIPFPKEKEQEFINLLKHTKAIISIRESGLKEYSSKLTGINYPMVLDPVLLGGRRILDKLCSNYTEKSKYILIYQIDSNPKSDISVKSLEKKFNYKVYTMTVPRLGSIHGRKGKLGVEDFLSLLKGAEFLVTNSFHGVASAILYKKQFFVYENGGVMARIDSLLNLLNINDRKVCMVNDIDPSKKIDFKCIDRLLESKREESLNFLEKYLKNTNTILKVNKKEKKDCCGCNACKNICPVHAISMVEDEQGFSYPEIDEEVCIDCGLCNRTCGFYTHDKVEIKAYGVKHNDINQRVSSRSGGAFVAFSDWILKNKGAIYGAVVCDNFSVRHIRSLNHNGQMMMKKAKYVQSDTSDTFINVKNDLDNGKYVLYTGTPCQIAGLKKYLLTLNVDTKKLYTCDLICHGVPSPLVWKDYVNYVQSKANKTISHIEFRDKEFGWDSHCESFTFIGTEKKYVSKDYTNLFYKHVMFRPSCYNCKFANTNRVGDITLGDFWGIEKNNEAFNDNKGVSLVLCNTEKGKKLFDMTKRDLKYFSCDINNCLQPTLQRPSTPSNKLNDFWKDYQTKNFKYILNKYSTPDSLIPKIKFYIKKIMYKSGLRNHP